MNAQYVRWSRIDDASFATTRILLGSFSTITVVVALLALTTANSGVQASAASSRATNVEVKKTGDDTADVTIQAPAETYSEQSYSESDDGSSQSWRYQSGTTSNQSRTVQNNAKATNIDDGNAIDISLDTYSSTDGTTSNYSSISVDVSTESSSSTDSQ